MISCINRIRLEFKDGIHRDLSLITPRINRIRLEFKVGGNQRATTMAAQY